ncbi:hypothetical protein [Sulfurimonas autotrophica]|uniref:Lipoprotein n=1 Tax=Sulfurimonas autotrophica (strain ATCC BAA-671 / DSM 16294 / JCM 11897 / OK10) TaxID=563040 RepID=E0UUJ2_SULAO|nr:hypothetical protein [Sulfurimonas autotrophica]ADN08428.1 hypothetical protein Saut_0379 [Sulfurimonas autotrophica DSM 16294]
MKNIIIAILAAFLLLGCSSKSDENKNVEPKLVAGKSLADLHLKDQFGKEHTLNADTYKVIFAFDKEPAHTCNDFFNTQKPTYLQEHHVQFVADVSAAPSIIRSLFILPGLKDFKHIVLLLDDKKTAAPYRKGIDTTKIVVVTVLNKKITDLKTISTKQELQKTVEDDSAMSYIAPVINKVMNSVDSVTK